MATESRKIIIECVAAAVIYFTVFSLSMRCRAHELSRYEIDVAQMERIHALLQLNVILPVSPFVNTHRKKKQREEINILRALCTSLYAHTHTHKMRSIKFDKLQLELIGAPYDFACRKLFRFFSSFSFSVHSFALCFLF